MIYHKNKKQSLRDNITNIFTTKTTNLFVLLLAILALPVTTILVQHQQSFRQEAATATATVFVTNVATGKIQTQMSTNNVWSGMIDQATGAQAKLNALHAPFVRIHAGDDGGAQEAMPEIKYNNWDFSALNALVDNVTKTGQKPLMNIKFAPDWMWTCYPNSIGVSPNQTQGTGTVKDLTFQTFAQYMARLVSYYNKGSMITETGAVITNPAGANNRIMYWEPWNEPDLNNETPCAPSNGNGITPAQYVTMWNAVTSAMLAVDPALKFVGPATAGSQFGSTGKTGNEYVDTLMNGSTIKPAAISFHGYGYWDNTVTDQVIFEGDNSDPTNHCCGGVIDIVNGVTSIHKNYPTYPIWLTEVNVNADWGNDTYKRPWTAFGAAWWGTLFQQIAPLGAGIINQYDVIDSPQFGLIDDQTGASRLPYWEFQALNQAFPIGSTILSSTSSNSQILSLAVQKPDGTITIMVVNRQVNSSSTKGGTGLSATVALNLSGINPTNISLQQLDATTNISTGPLVVNIPVSATPQVALGGYGFAVLTINTNGQGIAIPTPTSPVQVTPTATIIPTSKPTLQLTRTISPLPTRTPTLPTTPTSTVSSGSNLIIYDNAVSSVFKDNSFSYSFRNICDTSSFVSSPCSYAVTYQAYGALEFIYKNGSLNPTQYKSLDYNLNTGGQPISNFSVTIATPSDSWINEIILSSSNVTANLGNGWVHVSLPLTQLDPNNKSIGYIDLGNALNKPISQAHIDDVTLH